MSFQKLLDEFKHVFDDRLDLFEVLSAIFGGTDVTLGFALDFKSWRNSFNR